MLLSSRLFRNVHLAAAPIVGAYVYSSALREIQAFAAVVQWVVFPLVAVAGLALWLRPLMAQRAARNARP